MSSNPERLEAGAAETYIAIGIGGAVCALPAYFAFEENAIFNVTQGAKNHAVTAAARADLVAAHRAEHELRAASPQLKQAADSYLRLRISQDQATLTAMVGKPDYAGGQKAENASLATGQSAVLALLIAFVASRIGHGIKKRAQDREADLRNIVDLTQDPPMRPVA